MDQAEKLEKLMKSCTNPLVVFAWIKANPIQSVLIVQQVNDYRQELLLCGFYVGTAGCVVASAVSAFDSQRSVMDWIQEDPILATATTVGCVGCCYFSKLLVDYNSVCNEKAKALEHIGNLHDLKLLDGALERFKNSFIAVATFPKHHIVVTGLLAIALPASLCIFGKRKNPTRDVFWWCGVIGTVCGLVCVGSHFLWPDPIYVVRTK